MLLHFGGWCIGYGLWALTGTQQMFCLFFSLHGYISYTAHMLISSYLNSVSTARIEGLSALLVQPSSPAQTPVNSVEDSGHRREGGKTKIIGSSGVWIHKMWVNFKQHYKDELLDTDRLIATSFAAIMLLDRSISFSQQMLMRMKRIIPPHWQFPCWKTSDLFFPWSYSSKDSPALYPDLLRTWQDTIKMSLCTDTLVSFKKGMLFSLHPGKGWAQSRKGNIRAALIQSFSYVKYGFSWPYFTVIMKPLLPALSPPKIVEDPEWVGAQFSPTFQQWDMGTAALRALS